MTLCRLQELPVQTINLLLELVGVIAVGVAEAVGERTPLLGCKAARVEGAVARVRQRLGVVGDRRLVPHDALQLTWGECALPIANHLAELQFLRLEHLELGAQVVEALLELAPLL